MARLQLVIYMYRKLFKWNNSPWNENLNVTFYNLLLSTAPPKINVPSRFKDVSTFEKGEPVVMKIPFTGNPKPTVKWFRDGEEIKGRNYVQEVTDRHAILTIKEANKGNDGPYRLALENDLGTDSAIIKIQVNGELGLIIM